MSVAVFLARRFLAGRGRLLGTVAALALFGVALGSASLVVAMGLMSGYRHDLAERLAGTNAEILVLPEPGPTESVLKAELGKIPGVAAVARTGFAPGLLLSPADPRGADILVKGLDVPAGLATTHLFGRVPDAVRLLSTRGARGEVPTILGVGLARGLGVGPGSAVVLETSSPQLASGLAPPRQTPLVVAAVVETGFSEVDDTWAVLPLYEFDRLAPPGAREGVYELRLAQLSESDRVMAAARAVVGPAGSVLDWRVLNRDLFQALAVQQTLLFVVLVLIVAVAAGTVVSSLVVLLAEKTRDVGVLAALGAPPALIGRVFRLSGLLLGGAGLGSGLLFGLLVCFLLTATRAVRFPPEIAKVYYLSWMPFRPEPLHLGAILLVGLLLVLVASLLPARRAMRLPPAEALRYE